MRCVNSGRKEKIKNKTDKRFTETRDRFDKVIGKYLKLGWVSRLNTPIVSNEARVWDSTFYNHYNHMDEAIDLFFHKMDPDLKCLAEENGCTCEKRLDLPIDGPSLEAIFFKILYFIYQNRGYYEVIIERGNSNALIKIAEVFRPIIAEGWSNYGAETDEKCFCVFSWELSGVLYYWGSFENFDFDRISQHARELTRLARNATRRLVNS